PTRPTNGLGVRPVAPRGTKRVGRWDMKLVVPKGTRQAGKRDMKLVVPKGTKRAGKRRAMKLRRQQNPHRQRSCEPSRTTMAAGRRCSTRKKVNHETAPKRFSCRLRPKWRGKPSLPQTAPCHGTANPRKYARK